MERLKLQLLTFQFTGINCESTPTRSRVTKYIFRNAQIYQILSTPPQLSLSPLRFEIHLSFRLSSRSLQLKIYPHRFALASYFASPLRLERRTVVLETTVLPLNYGPEKESGRLFFLSEIRWTSVSPNDYTHYYLTQCNIVGERGNPVNLVIGGID